MDNGFPWAQIISSLIAGCALIFSVWSVYYSFEANKLSETANKISSQANQISKEANKMSQEALRFTKSTFITENRPYLNIEVEKYKDTNSFFKISREDDLAHLEIKFKLTNKGKVPAINISCPKTVAFQGVLPKERLTFSLPPDITLGPGQSIELSATIYIKSPSIDTIIKEMEAGMWSQEIQMVLFYQSTIEEITKYKSLVAYKIESKEAILLRSEMR